MTTRTPLHPSLPPKPQSSEADFAPQVSYNPALTPNASSSSSSSRQRMCAVCATQPTKYTCPGCATGTCSALCGGAHKRATGCSGERNKAQYVPLNEYTWGKMMDDYTFLEDMGRKVEDWGKEIVKGGYMAGAGVADRGRGRGRGRGERGRGRGRGGASSTAPAKTKRDILRMQLQAQDIEMEALSVGMERRKVNQSTWDFRNQTALLTIEFKLQKPKDPLAPSSTPREPPFTLLTHKNNIKTPLIHIIRSHIHERSHTKKDSTHPEWVKRLVYPDPDDPESFEYPKCVMAAQLDPLAVRDSRVKAAFYSLDPSQPLASALRHTEFVEFPTIEIWDEFTGTILDAEGIIRQRQEDNAVKRRKLNPKAGKATIAGLLGDYGSDENKEEEAPEPPNALSTIGNYAASDDEQSSAGGLEDEKVEMEDGGLEGSDDDDGDVQVDPVVLLELLRAAGGGGISALDGQDTLDWDDGDGTELE